MTIKNEHPLIRTLWRYYPPISKEEAHDLVRAIRLTLAALTTETHGSVNNPDCEACRLYLLLTDQGLGAAEYQPTLPGVTP